MDDTPVDGEPEHAEQLTEILSSAAPSNDGTVSRAGRVLLVGGAAAVVAVIVVAGVMLLRAGGGKVAADTSTPSRSAVPAGMGESVAVSVSPSPSASPSPSHSASPSASPSHSAAPAPSRKPVHVALPPPPHPPAPPPTASPSPGADCPSYDGTAASRSQVGSALTSAAGRSFWPGAGGPDIRVPANLVEAVAWQESGWQSNIVSCYGALGAMQVTPDSANWLNQRFGTNNDVHTVSGNAALGSEYLQWLVKYFGDVYFDGDYDLTTVDPDNPTLLDAVLAAYNLGPGAVDTADGLVIPNRPYVNAVEHFMQTAPWQS